MTITVDLSGLKELEKALDEVGKAVGEKVLRGALRDAAKPMLEAAKAKAPAAEQAYWAEKGRRVAPGRLKEAIRIRTKINRGKNTAWAFVGTRATGKYKDVYYARFAEFGTKPHYLGKGAKRRSGSTRGRMHPGARPHPFLRPALDENEAAFYNLFKQRIQHRLKLAQRRAARASQ